MTIQYNSNEDLPISYRCNPPDLCKRFLFCGSVLSGCELSLSGPERIKRKITDKYG